MKNEKKKHSEPSWYLRQKKSTQKIYERVWDKETCRNKVVVKDEYNLQELIQARDNSSDLALFVSQFNAGLIEPIKETNDDVIYDETFIPKSLIEFGQAKRKLESAWSTLDPKIKSIFGNEKSFRSALENGSVYESIIKGLSPKKVPSKKEVKEDGEK